VALWLLRVDAEQDAVTLTYFERNAPPKDCGRGDLALLADLEGWVIDQAAAWDRVQTDRGVFVRQATALGAKA
jgi:hypothetical protein